LLVHRFAPLPQRIITVGSAGERETDHTRAGIFT